MLTRLAQANQPDAGEVIVVVGAMIVMLMVGGAVIMMYRRRVLSGDQAAPQHSSMLDELRKALESGELTPDEYERARHAVVDRARGAEPIRREPPIEPSQRWDRVAEHGVDLTGDPLPRPGEDAREDSGPGSDNTGDDGE